MIPVMPFEMRISKSKKMADHILISHNINTLSGSQKTMDILKKYAPNVAKVCKIYKGFTQSIIATSDGKFVHGYTGNSPVKYTAKLMERYYLAQTTECVGVRCMVEYHDHPHCECDMCDFAELLSIQPYLSGCRIVLSFNEFSRNLMIVVNSGWWFQLITQKDIHTDDAHLRIVPNDCCPFTTYLLGTKCAMIGRNNCWWIIDPVNMCIADLLELNQNERDAVFNYINCTLAARPVINATLPLPIAEEVSFYL